MRKDSVLELKNEVLKSLWAQSAKQLSTATQTQGLASPNIESRLAVGYSRSGRGAYKLELRVQRRHGAAYESAQEFKKKAKQEANIGVVPSIEIPARTAVLDVSGQKELTQELRPLHIGLSIGHTSGGAGTLGAFVLDADGDACVLSNNHVLALLNSAKLGDRIFQPGRPDEPLTLKRQIGTLSNFCVITQQDRDSIDAAVATLDEEIEHESNRIPTGLPQQGKMIRQVNPSDDLLDLLSQDTVVCKIGRTTGFTTGRIAAIAVDNVTVKTSIGNVVFDNVIEINWQSNKQPFSKPGDSGSMVFTKNGLWAVGLHFAGGEKIVEGKKKVGVSYSCNMATILETLELSLLD
jgi:hypothetical protein